MTANATTTSLRIGAACLLALLLLELAWHAWLAPTTRAALALATLPLVPGLAILSRDLRRGVLVGGIASLFYFCHGVADLLVDAGATRLPASGEVLLALIVIVSPYGATAAQRRARRAASDGSARKPEGRSG